MALRNGRDLRGVLHHGHRPPPAAQAALLASDGAIAPVTDQLLEVRAERAVISNLTFLDTTYYADGFWDGPGQQPSDAAVRINVR